MQTLQNASASLHVDTGFGVCTAPAKALPLRDNRVLTFQLSTVEYAIEILCVQELRGYLAPTPLPSAPAHLKGVLDLRGTIVPVVDLRVLLDLPATVDQNTVTIVLDLGGRALAIVVDAVSDVVELQASQVQRAPYLGEGLLASHVDGVLTIGDELSSRTVLLVDIASVLSNVGLSARPTVH